ncbi:MAG: LPS-assembly protein LptD [Bacteroidota bacterium]|nr:LPS-assembly protein LptD [Bacteroidota bacterium]
MNNANKVSLKYISAWISALVFCVLTVQSKDKLYNTFSFHNFLTPFTDTIIPGKKKLTLPKISTPVNSQQPLINNRNTNQKRDTPILFERDTVSFKISKDSLDAVIEYNADDSMIMDVPSKKITLYGKKASIHYKDDDLSGPIIQFDQVTGNITASIRRDSTGKVIAMPIFKQGDMTSQMDSVIFNMKTGKGLTKSTYTQQGEMYVYGEIIKKVTPDIFYAKRVRITTCDLDTPHFAFVSNRAKFISKKLAITGPVHPEFEGVPIPIYLPFGIYPLSQGRHSGFLAPQFTSNEQQGLGLENLGYYKVLSDYWDVVARGNIYSYGGWTLNINPRYTKKYRYNGNVSFDVQNFKQNFKGDPDYQKNRSYHLAWSHAVDSKARPGVSFMASVNVASSAFNSHVPNNPYQNFSNQLTSSIQYAKNGTLSKFGEWWKDKSYNLSVTANHDQNTLNKLINVNLPQLSFNITTIYPFRKSEPVGTAKWYENLGVGYNGTLQNHFSFYDTVPNIFKHIADTLQYGAHHSIPITLSLPPAGAFQFAPSVSYDETWFQTRNVRTWNNITKKLDTTFTKGLYTARDMSFGLSVSTRIFGIIASKNKNSKIQAIRHEITPSLSFSYHPDLNKNNYYFVQTDTLKTKNKFSYYDQRNVFYPYSSNQAGYITFNLDNNLQMKVRSKTDTTNGGLKKISLLDNLGFNTSYDLFDTLFPLKQFSLNASTNLFNKVSITANAILDPYDVNTNGERIKSLLWKRKPLSFGRLINGSVSLSSQFRGGDKSKKSSSQVVPGKDYSRPVGYTTDEYQNELGYIKNNPGEYADFNIPWSVNFSYSLTFGRSFNLLTKAFKTDFNQNLNFGGTLNLTPKWQIGLNSSYNIANGKLGYVSASLSREMHCWQMAISIGSSELNHFFSINLSPKSGLLRDLRINRTRSFNNY